MKSVLITIVSLLISHLVNAQCTLSATINASSNAICSGMSVTLTPLESGSTGPYTYTWTSGLGNVASVVVAPNVSTTYTIDIMDSFGCIVSPTIHIQVQAIPIITATLSNPICNGVTSTSIICNGAMTYTLLPSNMTSYGTFPINIPTTPFTYTVMGTGINGCSNYTAVTVYAASNPTVIIYGNTTVCVGSSTAVSAFASGGTPPYSYIWNTGDAGNGIFPVFTATNSLLSVQITDANGCIATDSFSVTILGLPSVTATVSSPNCIGTTATITATSPSNCSWWCGNTTNTGNTATILITSTVTTTYTLTAADVNNCFNSQTILVPVDNTCQDVWPGDANSDGIADNSDILELGLHYTQTGAARTTTNNAWQAFHATNWVGTITNGKNVNHSDCNGDGTINNDDTLAIYNNYGLTHTFKLSQAQSTNPALNIVPDQTMVDKGKWGTASIYLGDATNVMSNVNGVAYTLNYDNSLIEQDSVYLTYQNSFIDAGQNLHFRKTNFTTGALYTASTHTSNTSVSGFGKLATLHYKIRPDLVTDSPLNLAITQAVVSNASGSITPITSGTSTVIAIGASVGIKDYTMNSNLLMYPNPTSEVLNVEFEASTSRTSVSAVICIYNALGALVLKENITSKQTTINTSNFAKGLYVVELQSNNQVLHRAKLIKE